MARALESVADCATLRAHPNLTFRAGAYSHQIARQGNGSVLTVTDGRQTISEPILWAFGQGRAGQTYVFKHEGSYYESRVSFYDDTQSLDWTLGDAIAQPESPDEAAGRKLSPNEARECFGCHSTGAVSASGLRVEALVAGVSCEACHGPGAEHVEAVDAGKLENLHIFNPGKLSTGDLAEFCGACHRSWTAVALMQSQGLAIGVVNVRFQPYRLALSRCYDEDDPASGARRATIPTRTTSPTRLPSTLNVWLAIRPWLEDRLTLRRRPSRGHVASARGCASRATCRSTRYLDRTSSSPTTKFVWSKRTNPIPTSAARAVLPKPCTSFRTEQNGLARVLHVCEVHLWYPRPCRQMVHPDVRVQSPGLARMKVSLLEKPFGRRFLFAFYPVLGLIFGLLLFFWPVRALRSDNFVFYFPQGRHVVRLEMLGGANYLALLDVLNAVGKVSGWEERRNSLEVWFGDVQLQLKTGDKKVKVGKNGLVLLRPVRVSSGQWMVPVDFLTSALPQLIHQHVAYQIGDKRAFIGDVKPISFRARLESVPEGVRLTVQFTRPVTVRTASQNGKWVVFLGSEAVEPPERTLRFQNPYLNELQFDDQDGLPKLILTPASDGLNFYPAQTAGGTTLVAEVSRPAAKPGQQPQGAVATRAPAETVTSPQPSPNLPVVVLDAGHGGENSGARSRDGLLEKDVVAALGERVRNALLSTQKYRVVLTRSGDADPSFDERAGIANSARPIAFFSLHAGNLGSKIPRLAVYTYFPSSFTLASRGMESAAGSVRPGAGGERSLFVPWAEIQQTHLDRSRQLAQALERQFAKIPGVTAGEPFEAPVRALRNVDAPAAAIEIGSFAPDVDARPLAGTVFEEQVGTAIVRAVESFLGG